jgi:tRNA (guanine37-N1)-methyltransferase
VDDAAFGGGPGMVMKPEPIFAAVEELRAAQEKTPNVQPAFARIRRDSRPTPKAFPSGQPNAEVEKSRIENRKSRVVLMSPAGRPFDQETALELSRESHLIIICGHYEGVDHRVIEHLVDLEISIGDYVLTNGAIAAVVLVDAIVRLLPGVLGHEHSALDDSFSADLLEAPQYTRPAEFRCWNVPEVLLSGNHAEIAKWRKEQALKRTKQNRPDLLK